MRFFTFVHVFISMRTKEEIAQYKKEFSPIKTNPMSLIKFGDFFWSGGKFDHNFVWPVIHGQTLSEMVTLR